LEGVSVGGNDVGMMLGVSLGGTDVGTSVGVGVLTRVGTVCRLGEPSELAHTFLLFEIRTTERRRNVNIKTLNRNCCIPPSPIGRSVKLTENPHAEVDYGNHYTFKSGCVN
jgi:hypothetical protein